MKECIVPFGEFKHERGWQILDKDALQRIFENLQGKKIVVDYSHKSFEQKQFDTAGILKSETLELKEDGIYGEFEWTGVYRGFYISPVFTFDSDKSTSESLHILTLEGVGLTNRPNIPVMRRL